jgi:hypothetical protein
MEDRRDNGQGEEEAIRRTNGTLAAVTERLRMLGLHQVAFDGTGHCTPVRLDAERRRELMIFVSELEELKRLMDGFSTALMRDIERHDRTSSAAAAYRTTGQSVRKFGRQDRH